MTRATMVGAGLMLALATAPVAAAPSIDARVAAILKATPLIDGHNDWAEVLREREGDGWSGIVMFAVGRHTPPNTFLSFRRHIDNAPLPRSPSEPIDAARNRKGNVERKERLTRSWVSVDKT